MNCLQRRASGWSSSTGIKRAWPRVNAQAAHEIVPQRHVVKTLNNNQQIVCYTGTMPYASALACNSPRLPTQPSRVCERVGNNSADASAPGEQPAAISPPNLIQGPDAAPPVVPPAEDRSDVVTSAAADAPHPASRSGNAGQGPSPVPGSAAAGNAPGSALSVNAPGSAAGSTPRRSALDGLSAEEQARRRAAIGRSGAGGTGRAGTGNSGPVANSRSLSKPERKARREEWETDLLDVAATHENTVKRLLGKYPEKGEATIRKLITHASTLKSSRRLTLYNAMLHDLCLKSKEESSTGKGKSSVQITQEFGAEAIREMMDNLEEHERVELLEQLGEYRITQRHGVRKSNKAQGADVRQNLEKTQNELDALFMRTGTRAMMFAVRSDTHDPNEPTFIETGGSRGFLKDYFDKSYQEIGHNYEMWSVAKGRGESKSNSMVTVRSEINKEVHAKLRIITGKKDAKMSWSNYEIDICEAHKVKMVGWLVTQTDADGNVSVKMAPLNQLPAEIARQTLKGLKNGTIFFVEMSKAEHNALVAKHDALRAANGPLKKRARRSDFRKKHTSRKRKAGEDEGEDKDEDEEDDEDDVDDSDEEGSAERRVQKKRRTSRDANAPNATNASNTPNAPNPTNASNASSPPNPTNVSNASSPPNPTNVSNTSSPPNPPNVPNALNAPKKKATKGRKGRAEGEGRACCPSQPPPTRWEPRPAHRICACYGHIARKGPAHILRTSTTASMASATTPGFSPELRAFGAPAPDSWGLHQAGSMPEMEFDPELMSLLDDAVGGGLPLQPLNGSNWALPPGPTPTAGSAPKHGDSNIRGMWGENIPPSAAGAAASTSASGPSPAPYLLTRFRL
ncbi:hypothetical protein MSAN_01745400 [Mycena sanguinolenta]|uniref:Uncharacterized protein n=1 Tax=Mycena sanguinolenta TaxID=230812 RepID=A0A8H6Y057_9AGAR|nr:hypothetical protein MSAN_01745400 [Mycena sanguinolenta]